MAKFKSKYTSIDAHQFSGCSLDSNKLYLHWDASEEGEEEAPTWIADAFHANIIFLSLQGTEPRLNIQLPTGQTRLNVDDWLIRDEHGIIYACSPDTFATRFEPA